MNAERTREASEQQTQNQDFKTRAALGAQLAAAGASGLEAGSGSLGNIQESTARLGRYDTLQTKYASEKQAVDYVNQAGSFEGQAEVARMQAGNSMTAGWIGGLGSLVSGMASAGSKWTAMQNASYNWNS